jgi:heat shock protein HtpX
LIAAIGRPPWCPECEWNLDVYDEGSTPQLGWEHRNTLTHRMNRRVDRWAHGVAFRLNNAEFESLRGRPAAGARSSQAGVVLVLISAMTAFILVALLGGALWGSFATPAGVKGIGIFLLMLAVFLRPRFPQFAGTAGSRLDPVAAPHLFALVDQVAHAVGVPVPTIIAADHRFNAYWQPVGIRRTRVLNIALPLWSALQGQGRVALLGRELGHLINGDPDRALLTQPALLTYRRLATLLDPDRLMVVNRRRNGRVNNWASRWPQFSSGRSTSSWPLRISASACWRCGRPVGPITWPMPLRPDRRAALDLRWFPPWDARCSGLLPGQSPQPDPPVPG